MDIFLSYAWGEKDASGVSYLSQQCYEGLCQWVDDHWGQTIHLQVLPLQQKAHAVAVALRAAGYSVWEDTEQMPGRATGGAGVPDAMAVGISSAAKVVVCFSEAYARSENCKSELMFAASTLRKKCYYVNVGEPSYTPTSYSFSPEPDHAALSWLPFVMRSPLWADCRTPEAAASVAGLPQLLRSLVESTELPPAAVIPTPAAAAAPSPRSPGSIETRMGDLSLGACRSSSAESSPSITDVETASHMPMRSDDTSSTPAVTNDQLERRVRVASPPAPQEFDEVRRASSLGVKAAFFKLSCSTAGIVPSPPA